MSRRCVGAFEIECVREGKVSVYLSEREAMHVCVFTRLYVYICLSDAVCVSACVCVCENEARQHCSKLREDSPFVLSHFPQLEAEWPQRESAMLLPITTTGVCRVHASLS